MHNRRISMTIESVMVTILLIILSVSLCVLIVQGSNTFDKVIKNKSAEENTRIAFSYINMRIKQNDYSNKINVIDNLKDGNNSIVIDHVGPESGMKTYIYYSDGYLYECYTNKGFDHNLSNEITEVNNLQIQSSVIPGKVEVTIDFNNGDYYIPLRKVISIRSF